jgi:hypothetical protein
VWEIGGWNGNREAAHMAIRISFGGGGIRLFDFWDWRLIRQDAEEIRYRPRVKALLRRLVMTAIAFGLAYGCYAFYERLEGQAERIAQPTEPSDHFSGEQLREFEAAQSELEESARRLMTESEWAAFQAGQEARAAERLSQRESLSDRTRLFALPIASLAILLVVLGLLAPMSCLWSRVIISRNMRGGLSVEYWGLIPRRRSFPLEAFSSISIYADEVRGGRYRQYENGYRWRVCMVAGADHYEGGFPEFWVDWQSARPAAGFRAPARVMDFVRALSTMTGVPHDEVPTINDYGNRRTVRRRVVTAGEPTFETSRQTFNSLDEVPEHLRPLLEELRAKSEATGGPVSITKQQITVMDDKGNVQTYSSPEEMPPDQRARYEAARRDALGRGGS